MKTPKDYVVECPGGYCIMSWDERAKAFREGVRTYATKGEAYRTRVAEQRFVDAQNAADPRHER